MKAHEFVFWLKGYLEGIDPNNKSLQDVIDEILKKADEVEEPKPIVEKTIEKEIDKWPIKWPDTTNPPPYVPDYPTPAQPGWPGQCPIITMYGCTPNYYKAGAPPTAESSIDDSN